MTHKLYNVQNLKRFNKNTCILYRTLCTTQQQQCYTYEAVIQAVNKIVNSFTNIKLMQNVGIAVKLKSHSPAACVLLLGVLNYNCHFFTLDDNVTWEETTTQTLYANGVYYLITHESKVFEMYASMKLLQRIGVLNDTFYVGSINNSPNNMALAADEIERIPNLCYIISTTGSTGKPKTVHVPYECIAPNVIALSKRLQIQSNDVIFLCAPLTFDPFVIEFFMALYCGACLLVTDDKIRLTPQSLLQILFPKQDECVTVLQMTPSLFRIFGIDAIRDVIMPVHTPLRVLILGGEQFPCINELSKWLAAPKDAAETGCIAAKRTLRIYNIYGITELSCWSTIFECDCNNLQNYGASSIPIGTPIDDETEMRIVNIHDGTIVCGATDCGELQLGSATRKCYIPKVDNDMKVDRQQQSEVLFRSTGDLVQRTANGDIYYIGRLNNTVKRFGKRICLDTLTLEIEDIMNKEQAMPYIKVACIWNEKKQKLYCILCPTTIHVNKQLCVKLIGQHIAAHQKPDEIIWKNSLPLNVHGKLNRQHLLELINNEQQLVLRQPVTIFKQFLSETLAYDCDDNDYNDDNDDGCDAAKRQRNAFDVTFMEAGGTSFQALSLASDIGALFVSPSDERQLLNMLLYGNATIAEILTFLNHCQFAENALATGIRTNATKLLVPEPKLLKYGFHLMWRACMRKCIDAAPSLFANRYICVGSHSHLLATYDAWSGELVASIELPDRIECKVEFTRTSTSSSPSSSSYALVGCYDDHLYACDFIKGKIMWHINAGGMIKAKPLTVCDRDRVIVGSYAHDFNLICICLKSQQIQWRLKIGQKPIYAAPITLFDDRTIFVCTLDGTYASVNVENCTIMWQHKCEAPIFSTPAFVSATEDNYLIMAAVSGIVYICYAGSGDIVTSYRLSANIFSSITTEYHHCNIEEADYIKILFGCHDEYVYCLKFVPKTMQIQLHWKTCLNATIVAAPIIIKRTTTASLEYVLACSTKGLLVLICVETGSIIASHDIKAEIFSTPCFVKDELLIDMVDYRMYFGSRDNHLYCFGIKNNV